jgi:hypothetical protein
MFRSLETDDVVAEHPFTDRPSDLHWKEPPVVRIGPWDVYELLQSGVWSPLADEPRAQIEVIVLKHDQRLAASGRCRGNDLIRKQLVYDDVAVSPGIPDFLRDVRSSWRIPKIMLEEPEQRVADDVVVLVVRLRIWHDEAKSKLTRIPELDQFFAGIQGVSGA